MKKLLFVALLAMIPVSAHSAVLLQDTFESYADDAAVQAVYTLNGTQTDIIALTSGTDHTGGTGKFLRWHAATSTYKYYTRNASFSSGLPISFKGWIRFNGTTTSRAYVGVRNATPQIMACGASTSGLTTYSARLLLPGGPNSAAQYWVQSTAAVSNGTWVQFEVAMDTDNKVYFTINGANQNGSPFQCTGAPNNFTDLRIGDSVSTTNANYMDFDDYVIETTITPVDDWCMY